MSLTIDLETKFDTKQAEQSVDKLSNSVEDLINLQTQALEDQKKSAVQAKDAINKNTKATKEAAKGTKLLAQGFKGVGLAIKAAGIGLIISALSALKEVFMQNQEIADAVATTFETVSIVFNEVVGSLVDTVKEVSEATNGFEALGKVAKGLLTIALTPLKLSFFQIVLGVKAAQLAWEKSFLGDGDPETIKRLTGEIVETQNSILEVGSAAIDAGKDIVTNFVGAVAEVSQVAVGVAEDVKKISIEAALETAKTNVALQNTAKLAAAEQQRLVEIYDRQAEKLRQTRDLESNSIEVRIQANKDLAAVLEEQEKALLKVADLQVASAQAAVDKNASIENQVALTEALANREGVLAQVEGFRSEQQANINGLTREANDLNRTAIEGEEERAKNKREFDAERQLTEELRIQKLRENLKTENDIILADLERKRELHAIGTQNRVDAEQEYLNKKQELDQMGLALDKTVADSSEKIEDLKNKSKLDLTTKTLQTGLALTEKNAEAQKGIAAVEAAFNTYKAANVALASAPPPFGQILAGFTIIAGLKNVQKILSSNVKSGTVPSGGGGSVGSVPDASQNEPRVPDFSFTNQGIGDTQNAQFNTRAYVINQDIKDDSSLSQRIDDKATV